MRINHLFIVFHFSLCFLFWNSPLQTFGQVTSQGEISNSCFSNLCEDQDSGVFVPGGKIHQSQVGFFETSIAWQSLSEQGGFTNIGGVDPNTTEKALDAIGKAQSRWGLDIAIITSSCNVTTEFKGEEQPSALLAQGIYNENTTSDLVVWVHYDDLNNTATFTKKFKNGAFTGYGSEADAFCKQTIEETIETVAAKSLGALSNPNPFVDPEGAGSTPWYFGLRKSGFDDEKNFYGVLKGTAGMGWKTFRQGSIPTEIWQENGQCVFDLPGGAVGPFNAFVENNPVMAVMQCVDLVGKVKNDENVRKGLVEAIQHPVKTANGILQQKYKVYTGQEGEEQQYYELGFDGASLIIALITLGSSSLPADVIEDLGRETVEASSRLREYVGKFPESIGDAFYDRIRVSLDDGLAEQMLEFFNKIGGDAYVKIINNVDLIDIWKNFRGVFSEAELITIFKDRFPDGGDFYTHFNEVFGPLTLTPGSPNFSKAKDFLDDILDNADLADAFNGNGGLVKIWGELFDAGYEAFRKHPDALEALNEAVEEGLDALDALEDALQILNTNNWDAVKALFKRGNDYNRTVRNLTPPKYLYHEVTVNKIVNGVVKKYRLDSYNPGQSIVSRKATDFDNIETSTFQNYVNELVSKYEVGLVISKPGTPINGQTLQGAYKLEVPTTNMTSSKLSEFQNIASQKGVEIIFQSE